MTTAGLGLGGRSPAQGPDAPVDVDRRDKGGLYARARIAEYWIVNLVDRALEVHREPGPSVDAPYGARYRDVRRLGADAAVSPLAAPDASIPVTDLLP